MSTSDQANEGEGNRTAAREYNKAQSDFARSGRVKKAAEDAAVAVDGPEGEELRRAEEKGKQHSARRGSSPEALSFWRSAAGPFRLSRGAPCLSGPRLIRCASNLVRAAEIFRGDGLQPPSLRATPPDVCRPDAK